MTTIVGAAAAVVNFCVKVVVISFSLNFFPPRVFKQEEYQFPTESFG